MNRLLGIFKKFWASDEGKIFLLSFAIQILVFVWVYVFHRPDLMFDDKDNHFIYVKSILKNQMFAMVPAWGSDAYRTPLYPLFMTIVYGITHSVAFIVFIQNILAAASSVLVFRLGKVFWNVSVGFIAAGLFMIEAEHVMTANMMRAEALFIFSLLATFVVYFKFINAVHRRLQWAAITGVLLGITTLIRPTSQLLIVPFLGFLLIPFFSLIAHKKITKKKVFESLLIFATFVITLAPWSIRNYVNFGTFKLAPNFAFNAYFNLAVDVRDEKLRKMGVEDAELRVRGAADIAQSFTDLTHRPYPNNQVANMFVFGSFSSEPYFTKKTSAIFHADPWFFVQRVLWRDAQFLINSGFAYNLNLLTDRVLPLSPHLFYPWLFWGGRFLWISMYLIIVARVVLLWRKDRPNIQIYLFCIAILGYFTLLALHPSPRYRLPANAFLFFMVAESVVMLLKHYSKRMRTLIV